MIAKVDNLKYVRMNIHISIVHSINELLGRTWMARVQYVFWECNVVADFLVGRGLEQEVEVLRLIYRIKSLKIDFDLIFVGQAYDRVIVF